MEIIVKNIKCRDKLDFISGEKLVYIGKGTKEYDSCRRRKTMPRA